MTNSKISRWKSRQNKIQSDKRKVYHCFLALKQTVINATVGCESVRYYPNISKMDYINLLKPTGHVTHQQFNIQQLYALPTLYLCVLYLSENKQRLVPLTA